MVIAGQWYDYKYGTQLVKNDSDPSVNSTTEVIQTFLSTILDPFTNIYKERTQPYYATT